MSVLPSVSATKLKGIDLDAPGNINGVSVVDVDMESFEEKPWRKPGRVEFHAPSVSTSLGFATSSWAHVSLPSSNAFFNPHFNPQM